MRKEDKHELACGTVNMRELNQLFDVGSGNIFSSLNVIKGLNISTVTAFCSHNQILRMFFSWMFSFGTSSPSLSSYFLQLFVNVSMSMSFTKCIHSFKPFGEFARKENLQQHRLDNKMKYVKICIHWSKWIEFHGWRRWSDKKVSKKSVHFLNGILYIRNLFFLGIFNSISVFFWPVHPGHNGTTVMCTKKWRWVCVYLVRRPF